MMERSPATTACNSNDSTARPVEALINELQDHKARLAGLDMTEEVNVYCDNLIVDVSLAIQSEVDKLNKLEIKLLGEIEEFRRERLEAHRSDAFRSQQAEIKKKIGEMSAKGDKLVTGGVKDKSQFEFRRQARRLIFDMSLLESKMKRNVFEKHALRLKENPATCDDQAIQLINDVPLGTKNIVFSKYQASVSATLADEVDMPLGLDTLVFVSNHTVAWADLKKIRIWDLDRQSLVGNLEHSRDVSCFTLLPNGWLASCSGNNSVHIWDIAARKEIRCFGKADVRRTNERFNLVDAFSTARLDKGEIRFLQALPTGFLASFSSDSNIKIWDPKSTEDEPMAEIGSSSNNSNIAISSAKETSTTESVGGHYSRSVGMGVLSNGFLVACYAHKKVEQNFLDDTITTIKVWDPLTSELVTSFMTDPHSVTKLLVLSNDTLLARLDDGSIAIYDLERPALIISIDEPRHRSHFLFAQHPNGYLFGFLEAKAKSTEMHSINIWDPETGQLVQTQRFKQSELDGVQTLAISPDGRRLICGDQTPIHFGAPVDRRSPLIFPSLMFNLS